MGTKPTARASGRALLALAIALALAPAHAENINVNSVLQSRLGPYLAAIYQAKLGQAMPQGTRPAVSFKGSLVPQGIAFTMPNTVPQTPLVLQQNTLSNCNDQSSTQHVTVSQSTTQTESWSSTDTVSAEVSVTVSYETPIGVGLEGSATAGYSKEWNQGGEKSRSLTWEAGAEVPVNPGKQVVVQFVVDQENLDIPYHVDFVASGLTNVQYAEPAKPAPRVQWTGSSAGAVVGGYEANGTKLYVCKADYRGGMHAGKVAGGTCNIGYGGKEVRINSDSFVYLYADSNAVHWVSNIGTRAISAGTEHGEERYVCRVYAHGGLHPGKVVGNSTCNYGYGGREERSTTFESLNTYPPAGPQTRVVQVNLEDYLPSTARTITLHGVYKGVAAVQGDFRVDTPKTLQCAAQLTAAAAHGMPPPPAARVAAAQQLRGATVLPKTAIFGAPVKPKPGPAK